jgi:di/tricarboxylate transporter
LPNPDLIIQLDDILVVQGEVSKITRAASVWQLGVQPIDQGEGNILLNKEVGIAEVLLPPRSSLAGKTVVDLKFGSRYHLNVLGLSRPGINTQPDLKSTPLKFGDILLVQGPWENILSLRRVGKDFVLLGQPEISMGAPNAGKAWVALLIMLGMLFLMITDLVSVTTASMLAGLMMVLTGCLTMDEAYQAINWKALILIAGMLPMSTALTKTGLIELAALGLTQAIGGLGPLAVMAVLFIVTSLFTQVLSNTATAVLIAPIALASARSLGINPQAFMMAVAIAASMAFGSPVASPANTLVMGAGNYKFRDYLKVGMPMIALMLVVSILVLPLLFPL